MNKILDTYTASRASGEHIEFELRFAIASIDEYKATLGGFAKAARLATISRTINIIKEPPPSKTRGPRTNQIATQAYAAGGIKDGALIYGTKRPIDSFAVTTEFVPYKIAIAAEAAADKFATDPFSRLRIKLRISFTIEQFANWRFDFTLVCELTNVADLARKRDILFKPNITAENFLDVAPFETADAREFEAELISGEPTASEIFAILDFIRETGGFKYTQTAEYQATIFEVAKQLFPAGQAEAFRSRQGLKHLVRPPISLSRATYFAEVLPNITRYVGTIKADGVGIVGYIFGDTLSIIGGDLMVFKLTKSHDKPSIYLAELIGRKQYVFDVYMWNGEKLLGMADIAMRIKHIAGVVAMLETDISKDSDIKSAPKDYVSFTTEYASELKQLWDRKYEFPVDGIIFGDAYKWKPPNKLTIDFLTMRAPASVIGRPPHIAKSGHDLYFLFCGINKSQSGKFRIHNVPGYGEIFRGRTFYDYYPIQFAPPSAPNAYLYYHPADSKLGDIHGRICEYVWERGDWNIERIRTDRDVEVARGSYFGNNISVANSIWDIIQDPLTFEMLCSAPEENDASASYFGKTDEKYKPANSFSSYVKNYTLQKFKGLSWVIDLAAGRGADIGRWARNNIRHALCIDNDADALKELITRQESLARSLGHFKTTFYTHRANLNDDYKKLLSDVHDLFSLPEDGVPLIVCNMAIHYMCESDLTINNFVMLVDKLCAIHGHFVFTCYNGARVFELIGDNPRLDYYDEPTLKYSIIRDFPVGAKLQNFGQVIRPFLSCAGGIYVAEYLVNIDYIVRVFKSRGFKLIEQARFDSLLEQYSVDNLEAYDKLTDADCNHLGLFDYVILQKTKEIKSPEVATIPTKCGPVPVDQQSAICDIVVDTPSLVVPLTPNIQRKLDIAVTPIKVIPTKDIKLAITIDDQTATAIREGRRDIILCEEDKSKIAGIAIGWRIEINGAFEVVVEEVRKFADWTSLAEAYSADRIGTEADFLQSLRHKSNAKKVRARNIIAIRVSKI